MFDIARHSFDLPDSFIKKYKNKQPEWGPVGFFTFKRTYARIVENENRTEEYWETCKRVVEGTFSIQKNHCKKNHLPWDERKAQRTSKKMFELMWEFKFLPPGRGLWAMGTDIIEKKGSAALNNCAYVSTAEISTNYSKPFRFVMDMSMFGVGCGFGTDGANTMTIPERPPIKDDVRVVIIPDTREGWVEALGEIVDAGLKGTPFPMFDYSKIRKAGEPIKTFGGTSSGPGPLKDLLDDVKNLLIENAGKMISSSVIVDIMNMIGRCVVAGNTRRSAEIALGKYDDEEFMSLKQDQEKLISHRWASNNSILAKVGIDYTEAAKLTAVNGEPGYQWMENARAYGRMKDAPNWADKDAVGINPCGEQTLHNYELCTLAETFPSRHESLEEYFETIKIAYLYAKTVTLVPTHWQETNAVMMKNRRIGTSQSGIIKAFGRHGRREMLRWSDEGYTFIEALDIQYSNWLGVPRSIKKTSIKPSGTISLLPGEPPGIHYPHSEFYIRRIRVGVHSPLVAIARESGLNVEVAVGQEDSTVVVEFPIKEEFFVRSKNDVSIWEQVANAVAYQKFWADNQVSVTVTFKPEEQEDIKHVLELYEDSLKGISFLPLLEHGYQQAPYEEITEEVYNTMLSAFKGLNFASVSTEGEAPKFCDGDNCEI